MGLLGFIASLFRRADSHSPRRPSVFIESLEPRKLLTAPYFTGWDFDFDTSPHRLHVTFNQNVSASVARRSTGGNHV
jgi:hypothetical protein